MSENDVRAAVLQSLKTLGHAAEEVEPTADLEQELGIDSLEMVELGTMVGARLSLPAQAAPDLRQVHTIAQLMARFLPLVQARGIAG